jgi:HSP20 family protein
MDRLVDRFFRDPFGIEPFDGFAGLSDVRVDVSETERDLTVTAELPGVDPEGVDVQVVGQTLTLRGEKKQETEDKQHDYHFVERRFGSFSRTLQLPATVDADKVDARFRNGVLTVTIAKRLDARPKRIEVRPG